MPTIVFASPKGGAGKSTSALLLATEFAHRGATVGLIDADPNRPLAKWAAAGGQHPNLHIIENVTEKTIVDTIDAEAEHVQFVVVDLEGTASKMVPFAISRADLVIAPTKASHLDAVESGEAILEVRRAERFVRHPIAAAILFTQMNRQFARAVSPASKVNLGATAFPSWNAGSWNAKPTGQCSPMAGHYATWILPMPAIFWLPSTMQARSLTKS